MVQMAIASAGTVPGRLEHVLAIEGFNTLSFENSTSRRLFAARIPVRQGRAGRTE